MTIREIKLRKRFCEVCRSEKQQKLYNQSLSTKTKTTSWIFDIHVVICCDCGFVFTSPCASEDDLQDYYLDTFAAINSTNCDYDFFKRLNFIDKYCSTKKVFVEVGSNQKNSLFHKELENRFNKIMLVEVINEVDKNYNSLYDIQSNTVDIISHYFVLEHIPNVQKFLHHCYKVLTNNGIMIVEVPDIELYDNHTESLLLHEHVNHFSQNKLKEIATSVGFKFLETSRVFCSRSFGFVAAFVKNENSSNQINFLITNEYLKNKLLIESCINLIDKFNEKLKIISDLLYNYYNQDIPVIIWGANFVTNRLETKHGILPNVTVIDSNPHKKNYLNKTEVFTPHDVRNKIADAKKIILFLGECYHEEVLSLLNKSFNKTFLSDDIMRFNHYEA